MYAWIAATVMCVAPAAAPVTATAAAAAEGKAGAPTPVLEAAAEPSVGDKAPDFSLPADDGTTFTLSAARKPVVLVFYPRAFTGG